MYKINSDVYCTDGQIGKLIKVAVDPHTHRVTDLIVEKGFLQRKDRVLPLDTVDKIDGDRIYLSISSRELRNYPEYREADFTVPTPDVQAQIQHYANEALHWATRYGAPFEPVVPKTKQHVHYGLDPARPVIGRGTRICNGSETIGYIDHLLVDPDSDEITHLVVRRGLLPYRVIMPIDMVKSMDDTSVFVRASREELEKLGRYSPRADADILAEIQDKLAELSDLEFSRITVRLVDGVVQLAGSVANVFTKRQAHTISENTNGVIEVENEIMTDETIRNRVSWALQTDPRTSLAVIDVQCDHGQVTLNGKVDSAVIKDVAEDIAGQQPGVTQVVNQLIIGVEELSTPPA